MAGSVAAILQSGNLFAYTMNNPVAWIDPTGLLAFCAYTMCREQWHRDMESYVSGSSQWICLQTAANEVPSSTVTMNRRTNTATFRMGMTGISASFTYGDYGVRMSFDGRMLVKGSVFTAGIMGDATEIAFLGSHSVYGAGGHAGIIIMINDGSEFWGDSRFEHTLFSGNIRFTTLGAGPETERIGNFGNLIAAYNHIRDVGIITGDSPNARMTYLGASAEQISTLLNADLYFRTQHNDTLRYSPFPSFPLTGTAFNSNSYARGLLNAARIPSAGLTLIPFGSQHWYPGWTVRIPRSYFGH